MRYRTTFLTSPVPAIAICLLIGLASPAQATHINGGEVNTLRPALGDGEGYLNFVSGAEYTGHTDGTETARDGGQDFSDNWFTTNNIVVTDQNGVTAAVGNLINDLDFTRKIYAQAGLAVRAEGTAMVDKTDFAGIGTSPFEFAERVALANDGSGRSANADTINIHYVAEFTTAANGITLAPKSQGGGNPYTYLRDNRKNNTMAHELGHMLFNGPVIHMQDPGDDAHSTDITNMMFTTDAGSSTNLTDVGPKIGAIGNHDIITGPQIKAIHGNPGANNPGFIKHSNNIATHGDRADFDWVTDHRTIETIAGGSNGADLADGSDFLMWEINAGEVTPSGHSGPGGDAHVHKVPDLVRPGYAAPSFNTVDVFSNINRYADNDTPGGVGGNEAVRRVKALDYHVPEFSVDGTSWQAGSLVNVFRPGWTTGAFSDDFVARYSTDLEAQFVRIAAIGVDVVGHDGNTQIDAIIAHTAVPEDPWIPWVPETILDPVIVGPSFSDTILVETPEGNTELFIPDARFFDPTLGTFGEHVTVPVTANASIVDDNIVIDVSLTQPLPDAFYESGNGLDMLFDVDLLGPGSSLRVLPYNDATASQFSFSPLFETQGGEGFADTSLMVIPDEVLHPDSDHFVSISLDTADGVDLLFFQPNASPFSGITSVDAELFFTLAPPVPDGASLLGDGLVVGDPLFTLTIATATQGVIPEPASLVLLGTGLCCLGCRRNRAPV